MGLSSKLRFDLGFWLFYGITIFALVFRMEQYSRPLLYFILMAWLVTMLGIQIYHASNSKKEHYYILAKIIIVLLTTQFSVQLIYFNSVFGSDPWYHETLTYRIMNDIEVHRVDYYGTLVFHYIVGGFGKFFGLNQKWATLLIIGVPYSVVITWITYKLGNLVHTYKTGLMSALALSTAGMFIYFSIEVIPSCFGMMMLMLVIYLTIKSIQCRNITYKVIQVFSIAILLILIMFTNALMALFGVVLLFLLWLGILIYDKKINKTNLNYHPVLGLSIAYGIGVLGWWTFGSGQTGIILRMIGNEDLTRWVAQYIPFGQLILERGLFYTDYFGDVMPDASYWPNAFTHLTSKNYFHIMDMVMEYQYSVPWLEKVRKLISVWAYGAVGGYGALIIIKNRKSMRKFGFVFMFIAVIVVVTNIVNVQLSRYFFVSRHVLLSQIMLAPMVAVGIMYLPDFFKVKKWKELLIGSSLFFLAFTAFISPYANMDYRELMPNSVVRLNFTDEELEGINEICEQWDGKLYSDWYVGYYGIHIKPIKNWAVDDFYDASEYIVLNTYSELPDDALVLIRNEIKEYPILVGDRYYRLMCDPDCVLIQQGFKKIYDNGVVRGYAAH